MYERMVWGLGIAATLALTAGCCATQRPIEAAHINSAGLEYVPVAVPNVPTIMLEPVVIMSGKALKVSARASYNKNTDNQFAFRPLAQGFGSVKGFQP